MRHHLGGRVDDSERELHYSKACQLLSMEVSLWSSAVVDPDSEEGRAALPGAKVHTGPTLKGESCLFPS